MRGCIWMMEYNVFKSVSFIQNASESAKESKKVIHKLQEDHQQLQYVCSAHASLTSIININQLPAWFNMWRYSK